MNSFISCLVIFHPLPRDANLLTLTDLFSWLYFLHGNTTLYLLNFCNFSSFCIFWSTILWSPKYFVSNLQLFFLLQFMYLQHSLCSHQECVLSLSLVVLFLTDILTYLLVNLVPNLANWLISF